MTTTLSKALPLVLRTYQYRPLTVFSLLDTDADRVLPHLFELCVKGGRSSRSLTNARDYITYRKQLINSGFVVGFDTADDQALLDGWLRSSVVDMGTVGRSRTGEQMLAVAPLTLAAYRAGLPTARERHRGIDDFVYRLLLAELKRRGSTNPVADLRDLVTTTVGQGLAIGPPPRWEPLLDDPAELDIDALLEFRFVEGFAMSDARMVDDRPPESPLPGVTADIGATLLSHFAVYGTRLPTQALMSSFAALLAVSVFTMSLRADAAGRQLLTTGELPADMREPVPPSRMELYCDFTGDLGEASDRLARRCVERDLERVRLAFRDRMTFVVIENALIRMPDEQDRRKELSCPEQLAQLASLRGHRRVETYAEGRIDDIVAEASESDAITETEKEFLREIQGGSGAELDKLVEIMQYVNQTQAVKNAVNWFWSIGGLQKPYGILEGSLRNRRSWRYAPNDELLIALLLAVSVRPNGSGFRPSMPFRDVLDTLRNRFGILVDCPPAFLDGAEARAAAATNLEAFKRRLQLLGCFDSLSDDFSVQVVRHPLGDLNA